MQTIKSLLYQYFDLEKRSVHMTSLQYYYAEQMIKTQFRENLRLLNPREGLILFRYYYNKRITFSAECNWIGYEIVSYFQNIPLFSKYLYYANEIR